MPGTIQMVLLLLVAPRCFGECSLLAISGYCIPVHVAEGFYQAKDMMMSILNK